MSDVGDMLSVSQAVSAWTEEQLARLSPVTLCVFSNYTLNSLEPFLKHACYRGGFNPTIAFGLYGAALQELRSPAAPIHSLKPGVILYSEWLDELVPFWQSDPGWDSQAIWESRLLPTLTALLELTSPALVSVTNFVGPFYRQAGETGVPQSAIKVRHLNDQLEGFCKEHSDRFSLLDLRSMVERIGEDSSIDYRFLWRFKAPWTGELLQGIASHLYRRFASRAGQVKKCLILDCDNTLWGGIVGEDGMAGIKLSATDYPGAAYYEFQKQVVALSHRGVVLALCSKNNEADVLAVLDQHTDCLLKRDALVAWRINWNNKADNIRALAGELNLGLDSLVFVDDNAYECGLVREILPQVAVLQVPGDLARLPRLLSDSGLFDSTGMTEEDRTKTAMYQAESSRKQELERHVSLEDYLGSLGLQVEIGPLQEADLRRVAQLTQKTNQFNLTTRRYTDAEIASLRQDPAIMILTLRCRDKFGAMGLTNVLIGRLRPDGKTVEIDTFLMSCRVFERKLEYALLQAFLMVASERHGVDQVLACYLKSPKNELVARFWDGCGFTLVSHSEERRDYRLKVAEWSEKDLSHLNVTVRDS